MSTAFNSTSATPTVGRDDLVTWVDRLLDAPSWHDYCPNGLQVIGNAHISRLVTAVSSNAAVFERAAQLDADMVIAHHGLFWKGDSQRIGTHERRRLELLFANNINLAAWHLPLDAHTEIGNNALIAAALGVVPDGRPFAVLEGRALGVIGQLSTPCTLEAFLAQVASVTEREPLHVGAAPEQVRTVAICSGGAADMVNEAIALGADAFITGEANEPAMARAGEGGIAFIAAGHYATETFGVRALGDRIVAEFGIAVEFVDVPNPV